MCPFTWKNKFDILVLISKHKDGDIISKVISYLGFKTIRGSTSKPGKIKLYVAGIFWTLGYDTIYAVQDGDWIKVENIVEGTVENIGFRSTVVRQFDSSPVMVPNFNFAENTIFDDGRDGSIVSKLSDLTPSWFDFTMTKERELLFLLESVFAATIIKSDT